MRPVIAAIVKINSCCLITTCFVYSFCAHDLDPLFYCPAFPQNIQIWKGLQGVMSNVIEHNGSVSTSMVYVFLKKS